MIIKNAMTNSVFVKMRLTYVCLVLTKPGDPDKLYIYLAMPTSNFEFIEDKG